MRSVKKHSTATMEISATAILVKVPRPGTLGPGGWAACVAAPNRAVGGTLGAAFGVTLEFELARLDVPKVLQ